MSGVPVCKLAGGCARVVSGGGRRQGLTVRLLHTLMWNSEARRAGGDGSLAFPRIAPLEEAVWASLPCTTPHHAQDGLSISVSSGDAGPGSDRLLPQPDSTLRPQGSFQSVWRFQQLAGLPGSSSPGCGLGGGGAEIGHTEPSPDLTSDPSCLRRDLLPFTLRLPRAILEASSSTDLEIISNLGLGKSPLGSEQETGLLGPGFPGGLSG